MEDKAYLLEELYDQHMTLFSIYNDLKSEDERQEVRTKMKEVMDKIEAANNAK